MTHIQTRAFWDAQNWSLSNRELAGLTGRKIDTVIAARHRSGNPESSLKRRQHDFWKAQDWSLCESALARKLGVCKDVVRYHRKRLNIKLGRKGDRRTDPEWIQKRTQSRIRITHEEFLHATDSNLARMHKCSRERVRQLRKRLGLPSSRTINQ